MILLVLPSCNSYLFGDFKHFTYNFSLIDYVQLKGLPDFVTDIIDVLFKHNVMLLPHQPSQNEP